MSIYTYNIIYQITNKVNNKIYIGVHSTNDLNDNYMGSGTSIIAAIKKYGKKQFKKEILYYFRNPIDAYSKEAELVNESFVSRQDTYNLRCGGEGGRHSDEAKRKMSEAARGKTFSDKHKRKMSEAAKKRKRFPHSEETRRKLSEATKGQKHTEETKRKLSDIRRNISDETRRKMSEAAKKRKRPHTEETKRKIKESWVKRKANQMKS